MADCQYVTLLYFDKDKPITGEEQHQAEITQIAIIAHIFNMLLYHID